MELNSHQDVSKNVKKAIYYIVGGFLALLTLRFFSELVFGWALFVLIFFTVPIWLWIKNFRSDRREWRRAHASGFQSKSAYAILGVDSTASGETIRHAYRTLAKQHHPDNYPEAAKATATELLLRINLAYELIGDEDTRFAYDHWLEQTYPDAPPLEEAVERLRGLRSEMAQYDGIERERGNPDPVFDDTDLPDEFPEPNVETTPIPDREPISDHPTTSTHPAVSGECSSCGEPYRIAPSRKGPIFCERCGSDLG